ncbi:hypothetical protein MMC13_004693 [Lambiella insularis]|nr:hypothetical protein [Lambiella insularis]
MRNRLPYSPTLALTRSLWIRPSHAVLPEFLAPTAFKTSPTERQQIRPLLNKRCSHHAANLTGDTAPVNVTLFPEAPTTARKGTISAESRRRPSQDDWVTLLDQYLPLEMRSKGWLENLAAFEGIRPTYTMPTLLIESRASFRLGILAYLAVEQGRWTALIWLIKELLNATLPQHATPCVVKDGLLHFGDGSLDDLTRFHITATIMPHIPRQNTPTLDEITQNDSQRESEISMHDVVGQIWQSVARIIIKATEEDSDKRKNMMSYAHRIIALLHHHGWVPDSIYRSESGRAPSWLQKPPMLQNLSSRILTILSDSVWRAQEQEVIAEAAAVGAQYVYKGHELPGAEYQPHITPLGTQVWLELVLWSCVESSMVPDAAKIVAEMIKAKGMHVWTVTTWSNLQELASISPSRAALSNSSLIQRWLNSIAGPFEFNKEVELTERTVSSEVIAAIADGLLSTIRDAKNKSGLSSSAVRFHVNMCKVLLQRQSVNLPPSLWNSIVIRLIEFDPSGKASLPGTLDRVLDLTIRDKKEIQMPEQEDLDNNTNHSGASLGLLHKALDAYIRLSNIDGALRIFRRLQNWVDENRVQAVQEFWKNFQTMPETVETENMTEVHYQIPYVTLAAFLDLLTSAKCYEIGRWLLYSKEVDGPVIAQSMYNSPILQPALLRYASATADTDLLCRVTEIVATGSEKYSKEILHAIIHCQIKVDRWQEVLELLQHITAERKLPVEAYDIMIVAARILQLERSAASNNDNVKRLNHARDVLDYILSGTCQVKLMPGQYRDLSEIRQINQCSRILRSVPGVLQQSAQRFVKERGQAHAPTRICVSAFNVLLGAVVDAFGAHAGKALCDKWCQTPARFSSSHGVELGMEAPSQEFSTDPQLIFRMSETTVKPDFQTIRLVLEPILNPYNIGQEVSDGEAPPRVTDPSQIETEDIVVPRSGHPEILPESPYRADFIARSRISDSLPAQSSKEMLLEWGSAMYQRMGLSSSEIDILLAGSDQTATHAVSNLQEQS